MKITNNTVLITGGSAGIGLEAAKLFSANGNKVIITGRNKQRLEDAVSSLENTTGIVSDISNGEDVNALVKTLENDFPDLNLVMNNAGHATLYDIADSEGAFGIAAEEMLTNYLSIIRLNEELLQLLKRQKEAAIINVSSIVAIVPGRLVTYSASKAALHSYTQSLRIALNKSKVKVFELMPPLVDTQFSASIGGNTGISPTEVATELIKGLEKDHYEIRVGRTQDIYDLFRISPEQALKAMQPDAVTA